MKVKLTALISLLLCGGIALAQTKAPASPAPAPSGPEAVIETSAGNMHCTLFPKQAPNAVANFVGLATGTKDWTNPVSHMKKHGVPLYNGTIFHRVIPDFMIQGGDPAGNGSGDPGYSIKDEIVPTLKFDRAGRLAYANSGPNTNGSQFFITEVPTPFLDGKYTIIGQCDPATVTLVKQIARMPRDQSNDRPYKPVVIKQIQIKDAGAASKPAAGAKKPASGAKKPLKK